MINDIKIFEKLKLLNEKIKEYYKNNNIESKNEIIKIFEKELNIVKIKRSLYLDKESTIKYRFLWTKFEEGIPSNTFLSIKNIYKYDETPIVVVLVRPNRIDISLGNTTFVEKISHSSKGLSLDNETQEFNLVGSVNYSNLYLKDNNIYNIEENWLNHIKNDKKANLKRILNKTLEISGHKHDKIILEDSAIKDFIKKTISIHENVYDKLLEYMTNLFNKNIAEITNIFENETNTKIRGEKIQSIITGTKDNDHEFADMYLEIDNNPILINIKTIDLTLPSYNSSPQAFSIEKIINNIDYDDFFAFYLFIITKNNNGIFFNLINFLEDDAIKSYGKPMYHWSGEDSRGHIQISGINNLVTGKKNKKEIISEKNAENFIKYINSL